MMGGGAGTGKIRRKKEETKEQIRLGAIEWLLRKLFGTIEEVNDKIDKLIDWKRRIFLEKEIEKECKHNWTPIDTAVSIDTCKKFMYFECEKCGKTKSEEIIEYKEECKHNWIYLIKVTKLEHTETIFECSRCDKTKREFECRHNWICITKNSYNPDGSIRDWIFECTRCGKHKIATADEVLSPTIECEHNWVRIKRYKNESYPEDWIVECSKCKERTFEGFLELDCEHESEYSKTDAKWVLGKECSKCGNHRWVEELEVFDCDKLVEKIVYRCSICRKREIEIITCNHDWKCFVNGAKLTIYRCTKCGKKKTDCVHSWMPVDTTIDVKGNQSMWFRCDNCGELKSEEITDELLYRMNGFCSVHKWAEESRTFRCDELIEKVIYKCLICGKRKTEIVSLKCNHKWVMMGEAGYYQAKYQTGGCSNLHWVDAWKYKCAICGKERIIEKEATLEDYAIGMKKVVDALPTIEQVAKNFYQHFCDHKWVEVQRFSTGGVLYKCTECEKAEIIKCNHNWTYRGINYFTKWAIYKCTRCGNKKEFKYLLPRKECNHNWAYVGLTSTDHGSEVSDYLHYRCLKCGDTEVREKKECEHNWVLIGSSSSFSEGTARTTEQIYECSKCGQRKIEKRL